MQVPLKIEPTITITVDNGLILVSSLPAELQNEIATLDAYNQEHRDALFEIEKINLLVEAKRSHVQKLLINFFEKQTVTKPSSEAQTKDSVPETP